MRKSVAIALFTLVSASPAMADGFTLESDWLSGNPVRVALPDLGVSLDEVPPAFGRKRNRDDEPPPRQNSSVNIGAVDGGAVGVAPQGRQMGVGLQLGSPTAVTFKYMLTGDQGLVAGLGVALSGLSLHLDYLWHPHVLASADPFKLSWYVGLGLWLGLNPLETFNFGVRGPYWNGAYYGFGYWPYYYGGISVAARMPLGLSLALTQLPLELYLELDPALLVFPAFGFGIGGTLGVRFYF